MFAIYKQPAEISSIFSASERCSLSVSPDQPPAMSNWRAELEFLAGGCQAREGRQFCFITFESEPSRGDTRILDKLIP